MFTDDAKIFRQIKDKRDRLLQQEDIYNLNKRSILWDLKFNPDKCVSKSVGNCQEQRNYKLSENSQSYLNIVKEEKDLGIFIDNKLEFDLHISQKKKK